MQPMKLEVYKSIVDDFKKCRAFGRTQENELKQKYKHIPSLTMGSIISLLVQRTMKQNYRKSAAISHKYHDQLRDCIKADKQENPILQLANRQGICSSLYARSVLQHVNSESSEVKEQLKDSTLIQDKDLAYQIFVATMNDNQYGPYSDVIKGSIGSEYEIRLDRKLKKLNIPCLDETILRSRGYDKTPDFKLEVPIAVDGFVINWIESKAMFGDEENHAGYLEDQLLCYTNRFGPGLVIYWFGYLETLDDIPDENKMIKLKTGFPSLESITYLKYDV